MVSPAMVPRAISIMRLVLEGTERRGYALRFEGDEREQKYCFHVADQSVNFLLTEPVHQEKNEKQIKPDPKSYYTPPYLYILTGNPCLEIAEWGEGRVRRRWTDGRKRRVEDCIDEFLDSLEFWAGLIRERRLKWNREEEERQARRAAQLAALKAREEEKQRVSQLVDDAKAWKTSQLIRDYVHARLAEESKNRSIEPGSELDLWAKWALAKAEAMNIPEPQPEKKPEYWELLETL